MERNRLIQTSSNETILRQGKDCYVTIIKYFSDTLV